MSDTAQLVKEKLDIAEFIRQYVPLTPAGKNLKGLCPFHKEKTPSFMVSSERQSWHCFGCNEGGDVIAFLMKYENLEFFEALKILAERAGIDLKQFGGGSDRELGVLYEINQAAKEFFKRNLDEQTAAAEAARAYLKERGLATETIAAFELGFAPNSSDALSRFLMKEGFRAADIERAGLTFKTERGTYWDRFRNRLMFPLMNAFGKAVGFTGRIMPGSEAEGVGKYVNSPETPIFSKSRLLYGFDKSKNFIREAKRAVLVEGQMDFLMAWQDGVKNLIATSGTALTADHLKTVRRLADELIVGFDADEAGLAATERVIDLVAAADFLVRIIRKKDIPAGFKDPADIAKSAPGFFSSLIQGAQPAMEFYFDRYLIPGGGLREKKQSVRAVLGKAKTLFSSVERAQWLRELSARTGLSERDLAEEMETLKTAPVFKPAALTAAPPGPSAAPLSRHERVAERLLALVYAHEAFKAGLSAVLDHFPPLYQAPGRAVAEGRLRRGDEGSADAVLDAIALWSGLETASEEAAAEEFNDLLRALKQEHYRGVREAVREKVRAAEQGEDEQALQEALAEFDSVSREMNNGWNEREKTESRRAETRSEEPEKIKEASAGATPSDEIQETFQTGSKAGN